MTLSQAIEALLFSAQKPLTTSELRDTLTRAGDNDELIQNEFGRVKEAEVAATLGQLKTDYTLTPRGFQLVEKAGGWQLVSHPDCARWIRQLFPESKPARLSPPALETLAIIAYRQPITRADVEAVRGVSVEGVLQNLMERGLVKISGRAELPGRPLLYETTEFFLEHFGLRNLAELPNAEELRTRYLPVAPRPPVTGIGDADNQKSASDRPSGPSAESATPATAAVPQD
ncbi:MAG: SMC-Scp complex subunit ScpB [Verrucomicrobia bacterium]|nr:MAG: SMC-Scp complex subunit ScpB [Verrucomicrobiota bacterium]